MKIFETRKFRSLRSKLRNTKEKTALKKALKKIISNPLSGKKLKGELQNFRSFGYSVSGQKRRIIYSFDKDTLTFASFGPREGIYG